MLVKHKCHNPGSLYIICLYSSSSLRFLPISLSSVLEKHALKLMILVSEKRRHLSIGIQKSGIRFGLFYPSNWEDWILGIWGQYEVREPTLYPRSIQCTAVVAIGNEIKPLSCGKLAFFKTPWQIKVLPKLSLLDPSLSYLRAFQWGTVWPCTSRGPKIRQVKVEKSEFTS